MEQEPKSLTMVVCPICTHAWVARKSHQRKPVVEEMCPHCSLPIPPKVKPKPKKIQCFKCKARFVYDDNTRIV